MVTASIAEHAMPVLHIDTGRTWGGGQQQVLYLHKGLLQQGIPSILVCQRGSPLARRAAAETMGVLELNVGSAIRVAAAVKVARICRKRGVRTIHMHASRAHSVGLLAERLLRNDVHKVVSRMVAFPKKVNALRRRKYLGRNIHYLAVSKAVKRTLLDLGVPEDAISVVHSGIDVDRFSDVDRRKARQIAQELGIRDDAFVVGSVGSLVPCKAHAILIEALTRVAEVIPNLVCPIVGEGRERPNLESLIRRKGLEGKVILTGQREEIPELLSLMDLFVMPSFQEGLGLALLEAMAAGKPVVASDVGGMTEVIVPGQTGILVPPAKPEALAEAMISLIRDPVRMSTLGSNAKEDVRERFSCNSMVEGTIRVYGRLCQPSKQQR